MVQKRGKENSIKPLVFFGVVVFIICLITCIYHVFDVRNNLEDEVNAQLRVQLEVASGVLSDEVDKTGEIVSVLAGERTAVSFILKVSGIVTSRLSPIVIGSVITPVSAAATAVSGETR